MIEVVSGKHAEQTEKESWGWAADSWATQGTAGYGHGGQGSRCRNRVGCL